MNRHTLIWEGNWSPTEIGRCHPPVTARVVLFERAFDQEPRLIVEFEEQHLDAMGIRQPQWTRADDRMKDCIIAAAVRDLVKDRSITGDPKELVVRVSRTTNEPSEPA